MEDGLKCFDEAKTDAQNASQTAQVAYNISKNAKQVSSFKITYILCATIAI